MLYSARLYKAVVGVKVSAVFCVCPEHPTNTKVAILLHACKTFNHVPLCSIAMMSL